MGWTEEDVMIEEKKEKKEEERTKQQDEGRKVVHENKIYTDVYLNICMVPIPFQL